MAWVIDKLTGQVYGDETTAVEIRDTDVVVGDQVLQLQQVVIIPHRHDVKFSGESASAAKPTRSVDQEEKELALT